jgi:tetratricopeptide (TPR) repeat protein
LPLIGFLLALGALLLNLSRSSRTSGVRFKVRPYLANAVVALLLLIWAPLSWFRSSIWRDELTLFVRTSVECPRSRRVESITIAAIFRLPHMREFLPGYLENGSVAVADSLPPEKAGPVIQTLIQAHRLYPDSVPVSTVLGFAYAETGQLPEAISLLESVAGQKRNDPQCWINLATLRLDNNDAPSAREACETALRIDPENIDALRLELKLCLDGDDYQTALACAKKLQRLEPQNPDHQKRVHEIEKKIETTTRERNPP